MKNSIARLLIMLLTVCTFAQQGINYKAVLKDANGNVLSSSPVQIVIKIFEGAALNNLVYNEYHFVNTDANGLVIVNIGEGDTGMDFNMIKWGNDEHFLHTVFFIGEDYIDMGATGFKAVPYAKNAATANKLTGSIGIDEAYIAALEARLVAVEPATIGDLRAGGIVFWVDPSDNTHGLVCAIQDQSSAKRWHNGSYILTNATGGTIGTGSANTDIIIGKFGPIETSYAAGLARAYTGGGFTDWFLPSRDELNQMYFSKAAIDATATANGGGIFHSISFSPYWSSTDYNTTQAHMRDFSNGSPGVFDKASMSRVRAVRAF